MNWPTTAVCILTVLLGATACAVMDQPEPTPEVETPPTESRAPPALVVAEEFGPLAYKIDPDDRVEWDRVLELHERLFSRQGKKVEEDDLHRLYNAADTNDDDVLERAETDEAFRRAKRDYERVLEQAG